MKKILAIIVLLCALGVSASAADMTFTPEGEGKWIIATTRSNRNQDLMNSDDNPPSYIMNNENLERIYMTFLFVI